MGDYYNSDDLGRFGEVGKYKPELFKNSWTGTRPLLRTGR